MDDAFTPTMSGIRDQKVLRALESHSKRLFGFIRRRVRSDDDAQDILQDVWLQFSRVLEMEPIEQVSAWLYRVARNRIADTYKKKKPVPLSELLFDESDEGDTLAEILFTEPESPDDLALRRIFWEEICAALDELPEAQRQVFIWNEIEGQTFQEISDRTGDNIKTLISRKRYAVAKLRDKLARLRREYSAD
jgi:RNA polymerase sigma factor (sigma-70 family)